MPARHVGSSSHRPAVIRRVAAIGVWVAAGSMTLFPGGVRLAIISAGLLLGAELNHRLLTPRYRPEVPLDDEDFAVLADIDQSQHFVRATIAQLLHDQLLVAVGGDSVALGPSMSERLPAPTTPMARRVIGVVVARGGTCALETLANGLVWDPEPARRRLIASGRLIAPTFAVRLCRVFSLSAPLLLASWMVTPEADRLALGRLPQAILAGSGALLAIKVVFGLIRSAVPSRHDHRPPWMTTTVVRTFLGVRRGASVLLVVAIVWLVIALPGFKAADARDALRTFDGLETWASLSGAALAIFLFVVRVHREFIPTRRTTRGGAELLAIRTAIWTAANDPKHLVAIPPHFAATSWMLFATSATIRLARATALRHPPGQANRRMTPMQQSFGDCGGGCFGDPADISVSCGGG